MIVQLWIIGDIAVAQVQEFNVAQQTDRAEYHYDIGSRDATSWQVRVMF